MERVVGRLRFQVESLDVDRAAGKGPDRPSHGHLFDLVGRELREVLFLHGAHRALVPSEVSLDDLGFAHAGGLLELEAHLDEAVDVALVLLLRSLVCHARLREQSVHVELARRCLHRLQDAAPHVALLQQWVQVVPLVLIVGHC